MRDRLKNPWRQIGFPTKIALYYSLGLVAFGAVAYLMLESGAGGTLDGMGWTGRITTAFFQSATRTSGFNTVDIGGIGTPMLFLLIILMFIGASSSSTGGGIKTSTFAVASSARSGPAAPPPLQADHWQDLRSRAWGILMFFLLFNLVGTFARPSPASPAGRGPGLPQAFFEQVSAMVRA